MAELGNKECVELLEKWLGEAKRGDINHVALGLVIAPNRVITESAGSISSQIEMFVALDELKARINQGIANRVAPVNPSLPANHVCFNIAMGIVSYDFVPWIIGAEMYRLREGIKDPLQVSFFRAYNQDIKNSPYHMQMLQHVVGPLVQAIGGTPSKVQGGKSDFSIVYKDVTEAARKGEAVPKLQPIESARNVVEGLTKDVPPFVTITLRETEHYPQRNSDLGEWIKFAKWLEAKGEEVIFVRDTAKATEELDDHSTFPLASTDLHIRLALYEKAKHNFFVSNGPATLCWHLNTPFTTFIHPDEQHRYNYAPAWPEWWKTRMGIDVGEQFPWFADNQRIVWKKDDLENLQEAWE